MMKTEPVPSANREKELAKRIRISDLLLSPFQSRFEAVTAGKGAPGRQHDIEELAASIEANGLLQPILVRPLGNRYEIIDGHRRVQAMRKLGRGQVMAIIKEVTDREAQIIHVIGNLQRKNLKPVEQALTYQKMIDSGLFKDKRELSRAIGKDETFVGDMLGTLQLDPRIIEALATQDLIRDLKVLRLIRRYAPVGSEGRSDDQWEIYRKVVATRMSRKELSALVSRKLKEKRPLSWTVRTSPRKITFTIETSHLSKTAKEKLLASLRIKMEELAPQGG